MIKAILIDDEVHCLDTLSILLSDYCPDVHVMERCMSAKQGLLAIEKNNPALVFLDIEMPVMNGFELLTGQRTNRNFLMNNLFEIIGEDKDNTEIEVT